MDFKKAKTIAKAFIEPLPEGQDWYEKRLSICKACPYNTENIESKDLSLQDKLQIKTGLCDNGNHCTACKCCIERKCATRTENCGLEKIDLDPKWKALSVQSKIRPELTLENMTPNNGNIIVEDNQFTYDFGIQTDSRLQFIFRLRRAKGELDIKSWRVGCSCTAVDSMSDIDKNTMEFAVSVSTNGFRQGWNERKLFIIHNMYSNTPEEVTINIKVNKLNGK